MLPAAFNLELDFSGGARTRAGLLLLAGFLVSFAFIRMSARLMRSPKVTWWPGSIKTEGGLHVHHLVFGIVLLLLAGFLAFAFQPTSPWIELLAMAFGVGAGLTLDEYALWLHLEDVYWAEEGRRSIDAVIMATLVGGLFVVGIVPLADHWVLDLSGLGGPRLASSESVIILVAMLALSLGACTVAALKGKVVSALAGMFVPFIGWVTAIRLARPGSPWARRRYPAGGGKLGRATARFERHDRRYRSWQDRIGGAPTPVESLDRPAGSAAEPPP